jgi:ribosomal protein L11 methyltransferase
LKTYPALTCRVVDPDILAAAVDDYSPLAIEPRETDVRVFFANARDRDAAQSALAPRFDVSPLDVSDEDWPRRSQENLQPVTVGSITVFPNPQSLIPPPPLVEAPSSDGGPVRSARGAKAGNPLAIVIQPSMGFGTGHHATTRLCLQALQAADVRDRTVLDVGTGSGILAIAADRLGAARAMGIDVDADAIQSARENLGLNADARRVTFDLVDLTASPLPQADIVTANLTGALLVRSAPALAGAVRPGGTLIVSGLLTHEREAVCQAFAGMAVTWEAEEDGWVGIAVKRA